jgi:hypothetical protein
MSNCITLHRNQKVVFLSDEIDVEGFKAMMATAKDRDYKKGSLTPEEVDAYYAFWFLRDCSFADRRGVIICFGEGRSSHTNRDFEGTLKILSRLIKKPKYWRFVATDEFDGHKRAFWINVEFQRGVIV